MTTDTRPKEIAIEVPLDGAAIRIGGICKGSGMIAPNMATMLAFLTTDAVVWPEVLQAALHSAAEATFNCVTVDGDCSTNDTLLIMASGASGIQVSPGSPGHAGSARGCSTSAPTWRRACAGWRRGTKLVEIQVRGTVTTAARVRSPNRSRTRPW